MNRDHIKAQRRSIILPQQGLQTDPAVLEYLKKQGHILPRPKNNVENSTQEPKTKSLFPKTNAELTRQKRHRGDGGKVLLSQDKDTKDIYDFYLKWLNNPEYSRRIDKSGFYKTKGSSIADYRKKALQQTSVEHLWPDNNYYDSKTDKIVLPTKWNWLTDVTTAHEVGHVLGIGNPQSQLAKPARLSTKEMQEIIKSTKGYNPNYEETGLPGSNGNSFIPEDNDIKFKWYGPGHYGKGGVLNRLYNDPIKWSQEYSKRHDAGDRDSDSFLPFYLNSPEESKANLMSFRYWLYKKEIYDINSNKPFTKEHLRKAKTKGGFDKPTERLFDTFDDDKIIYLMNTLAQNTDHQQNTIKI